MRAFLLAAGKGSRISKNIPEIPKSTLEIGGKPLICRTIEMLLNNGIAVTVIIGYKENYIRKILESYEVEIIDNPFYDVTNSIASLWMAKDSIREDESMIVANADVFWEQRILDMILCEKKTIFMLSDVLRRADGDYFFNTKDGVIKAYGKELDYENRTCEYVGIAYIDSTFVGKFKKRLDELIHSQKHDLWWENVLYSYAQEEEIYALDVDGKFWAEIDFIEDYYRILEYLNRNGRGGN